jgi:sterol desaturase/sphingolipid hydroxylase (fatty acid hydroxylase superfamily)
MHRLDFRRQRKRPRAPQLFAARRNFSSRQRIAVRRHSADQIGRQIMGLILLVVLLVILFGGGGGYWGYSRGYYGGGGHGLIWLLVLIVVLVVLLGHHGATI